MNIQELKQQPNDFQFTGLYVTVDTVWPFKSGGSWTMQPLKVRDDVGNISKVTLWNPQPNDAMYYQQARFYIQNGKVKHGNYNGKPTFELVVSGSENFLRQDASGGLQQPMPQQNFAPPQQPQPQQQFAPQPQAPPPAPGELTDMELIDRMEAYAEKLKKFIPSDQLAAAVAQVVISYQQGKVDLAGLNPPTPQPEAPPQAPPQQDGSPPDQGYDEATGIPF